MMSCKEVTRLISEGQERQLTLMERAALKWHTMMCTGCTNFGKHMDFLRKTAAHYREGRHGDK